MTFRNWATLCVFGFQVAQLQAAGPPLAKEKVAELLEYPSESVVATDRTDGWNKQARRSGLPAAISVYTYMSPEQSTAPLTITIAEAGSLLTDEMRRYAEQTLAAKTDAGIRKIEIEGVGHGYSGIGTVGPGGS